MPTLINRLVLLSFVTCQCSFQSRHGVGILAWIMCASSIDRKDPIYCSEYVSPPKNISSNYLGLGGVVGVLGGWVCCKFQVKSPVVPVDFGEVVNHIISILLPQTDRKTLLQHQNHTTKRSTPGFSRISTNFVISDVARNSWHFPREIRGGRKWFEITQKQAKEQKLQKSQQFRRTRGNGWIF